MPEPTRPPATLEQRIAALERLIKHDTRAIETHQAAAKQARLDLASSLQQLDELFEQQRLRGGQP